MFVIILTLVTFSAAFFSINRQWKVQNESRCFSDAYSFLAEKRRVSSESTEPGITQIVYPNPGIRFDTRTRKCLISWYLSAKSNKADSTNTSFVTTISDVYTNRNLYYWIEHVDNTGGQRKDVLGNKKEFDQMLDKFELQAPSIDAIN